MSITQCALTGEPLEDPVISKKSGHVFEKRVIEKHIESTGQCPITDLMLSIDDLIAIKVNPVIKPRPPQANSIPGLISIFQTEWDSLMLETYKLKQHLETVRQELSHALYQHDAACRVITRLIKERDEARNDVAELKTKFGVLANGQEMIDENTKNLLEPQYVKDVEELAQKLNKQRKSRKKDPSYIEQFLPVDVITNFNNKNQIQLHQQSGLTSVAVNSQSEMVVAGSENGSIVLYDKKNEKILLTTQVHKSRINEVQFAYFDEQIRIVSVSNDQTLKCTSYNIETKEHSIDYIFEKHSDDIKGISVHPLGYLAISVCKNGQIGFHDLLQKKEILFYQELENQISFSSIKVHPDGSFMAMGTSDGNIIIWNICENNIITTLNHETKNIINSLSFSENGYQLAASLFPDNQVQIWDLRNSVCQKVIEIPDKQFNIQQALFDFSAQILAVTGQKTVKLFSGKNFEQLASMQSHNDIVTSIGFESKTKYFVTGSLDKNLVIHQQ